MSHSGIIKTAHYLSKRINTNSEVCLNTGLSEEWIIQKTGIKQRHHSRPYETAQYMATMVAKELSEGLQGKIGLIIIASFSQDYMFPPMSAAVHQAIGASKDCQVMDINVNCVGLITGTTIVAERMRADESIQYALVIGVELLSKYVDPKDKFTAPFFSDGASGVLLGKVERPKGYIDSAFCTDSSSYHDVKCARDGFIWHDGRATWTQAITNVPYVMKKLVEKYNGSLRDVDFFIFHQANKVLIDYIMDKNRIPREKTYTNVQEIGNTGAASIGIALDEAIKKGHIRDGMVIMMAGVGAGFNFGASLWRI